MNKVVHSLARAVFSMSRHGVYDSVPRCIATYLSNEICWVCFCQKKKLNETKIGMI
jgi:hypothetical protein